MPLRLPRPVITAAAIGLAVAWSAAGSVPALANGATRTDQTRTQQWWLNALHIPAAWQTTKGSGVTIALLDTGVAAGHPDLAGSVIAGPDFTRSGEKPGGQFFGFHGTAMASLIVGHGHGSGGADGVVGVAPEAKLLSVRVILDGADPQLADSGITSGLPAAIAAGIRFAVANGAQVIDLPLDPGQSLSALTATPFPANPQNATGQPPGSAPPADAAAAAAVAGGSQAEQSAIKFALSQGVILVAPAGDNNTTTDSANFPAAYPGVIAVGAFDKSFTKAPFTSHQPYVALTAAGSGMVAAQPGGGYAAVSSTSAASAIVTGIAALIKSQYPELTPAQVLQALTRGTGFRHSGAADGSGAGTADAARALAAAKTIAVPGPPRAGAGAVSAQLPSAPPVPAVTNSLTSKLRLDGIISAALLVVLLLPTLVYAMVRRRRSRVAARVQVEPVPATHTPYAYNPVSDTELVSEYFAPLPAEPGFRGGGAEVPGRRPAMSSEGAPDDGPDYGRGGDSADPMAGSAPGTGPIMPRLHVPFARLTVTRPPKVSGSPPWGPAPKPEGELPWAAGPVPSLPLEPGRGEPARPAAAPMPKRRPEPPRESLREPSPSAGADEDGTDTTGPPIYVWNPGETPDGFPEASGPRPEPEPANDKDDWRPYGWQEDSRRQR